MLVLYPMEPIATGRISIYSKPVQKMCRKCVIPKTRFLVIAAPRPSVYQTWIASRQD